VKDRGAGGRRRFKVAGEIPPVNAGRVDTPARNHRHWKHMRLRLAMVGMMILAGCSDTSSPEKKIPEPPPEAVTGRRAFQSTYGLARTWASDIQPLRIRSINLPNPKSEGGKAGAWEIVYVSESKGRSRAYTWSAVEAEGNLHKGVFAQGEESWSAHGSERPFPVAGIKVDTPEVLETAITKSASYLKNPKDKPAVNFMLESTSRYPNPAWRVFWGDSVSAAEWSVFVDATTGQYLGR